MVQAPEAEIKRGIPGHRYSPSQNLREHEPAPVGAEPQYETETLLLLGALLLACLSLFHPWGSTTANKTLASQPSELLYNIPMLVVLAGAVVLRWVDLSGRVTVAISTLVAALWVSGLSSDVLSTMTHRASLGTGAELSIVVALLAVAAVVHGWIKNPPHFSIDNNVLIWAGASSALAVGWVVGEWMPWNSWHLHTAAGGTFRGTGTHDLVVSCCVAFRNYTMPNSVREVLTMAFVVVAAITVAFLVPRRVAGIALISIGVLYLADSLSWFYGIAQGNPNPVSLGLGITAQEAQTRQMTASLSGMPGGWIATMTAFLLIVLGVFRLLSTFAQRSSSL